MHSLNKGGIMPLMSARFDQEIMRTFGQRLKAARKGAGFPHAKEFAEALGVEENRYRHWERGTAQPNLAMLVRITRLLKVEISDLVPAAYQRKNDQTPPTRAVS